MLKQRYLQKNQEERRAIFSALLAVTMTSTGKTTATVFIILIFSQTLNQLLLEVKLKYEINN